MIKTLEGKMLIEYKGRLIPYKKWNELPHSPPKYDVDWLLKQWENKSAWKPGEDHPWRKQQKGATTQLVTRL